MRILGCYSRWQTHSCLDIQEVEVGFGWPLVPIRDLSRNGARDSRAGDLKTKHDRVEAYHVSVRIINV